MPCGGWCATWDGARLVAVCWNDAAGKDELLLVDGDSALTVAGGSEHEV